MKALILAAGRGTRLAPLTDRLPKPMLPVLGVPVMVSIVKRLAQHGFDEIAVNLGANGELIEQHFGDGSAYGVRMVYLHEGRMVDGQWEAQPMGSAATLREIQRRFGFFDDTFAVVCGDALFDLDLSALLALHRERGSAASMALTTVSPQDVQRYGIAVVDAQGRVDSFQEKPAPALAKALTANTGIYLFEPSVLDAIPPTGAFDIGGDLFPRLLETGAPVHGFDLPMQWLDIGVLGDFLSVNLMAVEGRIQGLTTRIPARRVGFTGLVHAGLGVQIPDDLKVQGRVWIGAGARIGRGVHLVGPLVIGAGCEIGDGAFLAESVVLPNTRVHRGAALCDALVQADKAVRVMPAAAGHAPVAVPLSGDISCDARSQSVPVPLMRVA